jgi:hypothetical protein
MHRRIGFMNVLHATSEIWSIGRQAACDQLRVVPRCADAVGAGRASLGGALPLAAEIFQLLWRGCRFFSLLVSEATPIHVTFSEKAL